MSYLTFCLCLKTKLIYNLRQYIYKIINNERNKNMILCLLVDHNCKPKSFNDNLDIFNAAYDNYITDKKYNNIRFSAKLSEYLLKYEYEKFKYLAVNFNYSYYSRLELIVAIVGNEKEIYKNIIIYKNIVKKDVPKIFIKNITKYPQILSDGKSILRKIIALCIEIIVTEPDCIILVNTNCRKATFEYFINKIISVNKSIDLLKIYRKLTPEVLFKLVSINYGIELEIEEK